MPSIRRALISVSDKSGIVDFARALRSMGVEIVSTGGTLSVLREHDVEALSVSEITGFPEILNGRLKTLHPKIHGALLAVADNPDHEQQLRENGIDSIDMVVVNLYPFQQTITRKGVTLEEAVEQIDIGGPTMIRSAAKNFRHKAVLVNPTTYSSVLQELKSHNGFLSEEICFSMAREGFRHTTAYDARIADYLETIAGGATLPEQLRIIAPKCQTLRYGENPHQQAALYGPFRSWFSSLHGKELSYNNIADISAASLLAAEFDEPTVVIVKHTNPCGVGSAPTLADAYKKAFATDTKSPFGGIVAVNKPLDQEAAELINQVFTEVIIAPDYPGTVLDFLRRKKDRRIVRLTADLGSSCRWDLKSVAGGYLLQDADSPRAKGELFRTVTRRHPTETEERALRFAWRVAKHVKSNAIVYAHADRTMGIGAGQMSRVDAARIAATKAGESDLDLNGTAVGSDAFFPFADGLLETVQAGATAVIQPGGSVRDDEVIRAADEHNIAMVFTEVRHFRH
ncbi:MAG: bifunctional phosphoribosylaminoimidazolecarboxamide formyltransferase/IMP cyclohydrolase [Bacteroidota bacterium]